MREDPRRAVIEVIQRLGRETQFHIDERYRHFQITDVIIIATSVLLVVGAVFNVYHARLLYQDFNGMVANMYSMHDHLVTVDGDMATITANMNAFESHMSHMDSINARMASMASTMPQIRANTNAISSEMNSIEQSMEMVGRGMGVIDTRVHAMTGGVASMREGMGQFSRPVSGFLPFMP